jgi:hypothetical protein
VKSPIALLIALPLAGPLLLASSACRATSGASAPVAVAFASLAEGSGESTAHSPRVIRTASGLERLWAQLAAPGALPQVDFTRQMVVFAAGGTVERIVAEGGFLRVELASSAGAWQLARVPLSEAPVRFESVR